MSGNTEEDDCPLATSNPNCPYIVTIHKNENNIDWLKRGYWLQVGISAAGLFSIIGFIFALVNGVL